VRIAISGTHRVGKTSLAEALAEALAAYQLVPEPYEQLEEDGHEFAELPSLEDFELQLERACQALEQSAADVIFDRCPLDILGYLLSHRDAEAFELDEWLPRIQRLASQLDLIVFVPIEDPDRVRVEREQAALRAQVDTCLRDIILDDAYGLEVDVLEATGTIANRLRQVLARLHRAE
jgi:hypothetical protein